MRADKLLLTVIVLALALAPLRGTYALITLASAGEVSHCAAMAHSMRPDIHRAGTGDRAVDGKGHCCGQGCDGTCCHSACAHVPVALTGAIRRASGAPGHDLRVMVPERFAERTVSPPFRPPISIPG